MPSSGYKIYENAIIVPPTEIGEGRYDGRSGVFDSNGAAIPAAITYSMGRERHKPAEFPTGADLPFISGTHSFGGVFFGHFGHFITESTGRLWVLNVSEVSPETFIYVPKERRVPPRASAEKERLLLSLGIEAKINVIDGPVRVERLIVPNAEFGLDDSLIDGTPRYVSFMKKAAGKQTPPEGAELLYISRQGLPVDRGTILGESLIEDLLSAEGYTIWRPQMYPVSEQVAQYRAAKKIISVDASPLHLYAYAANGSQKVSIIKRRSMHAYRAIVRHIKAFSDPEVRVIDALTADYVRARIGRIGRSSWGEVDMPQIGRELAEQGMILHPERWRNLTEDETAAQLAYIEEKAQHRFIKKPVKAKDG